ncbi:TlpA family protein disulfide reductase [Thiospirochaeta perfilievii]|uniref:TlpA family protein disulfide reductase n=1 Tax=Thiospirochaeta perfilievii TaxID=252967 RepID=A0A5C1QAA9_9SPIO|nr:TlpA disulfide reductase family protein [Thiospirochaeta perfilievii]QEN04995.1 TlpA family protein disulfide reductase [Thiospirochaeta perfilievii]
MKKINNTVILLLTMLACTGTIIAKPANEEPVVEESSVEKTKEVVTQTLKEEPSLIDKLIDAKISAMDKPVPSPDFTIKNLNGEDVTLSDYKGQALLLNFWASWCGPCKMEMPSMERLEQIGKDKNFRVLAVNLAEPKETVEAFIDNNNYTFDVLLDSDNQIGLMYGARSIPTTYLVDKDGNIVGGKIGTHEWDDPKIVAILEELGK